MICIRITHTSLGVHGNLLYAYLFWLFPVAAIGCCVPHGLFSI